MRTYGRLREVIRSQYKSFDEFAKVIPMSRCSLSRKLNGLVPWSHHEIERVCVLLGIPLSTVGEYFFYS